MARNIGMGPASPLYRAVVTATYSSETQLTADMKVYGAHNTITRDGLTLTWFEGPYNAPGRVRARRTLWRRVYGHKSPAAELRVDLETCAPQWKPLPEHVR